MAVLPAENSAVTAKAAKAADAVQTALDRTPLAIFKYSYAVVLLAFSIFIIMGLIFTGQTSISHGAHPALAFVACSAALIWLSMVEGGQCSLVGLPPVDRQLYKESHPITYEICKIGHRGDNLDRYLMGRQFLVVFIVFLINLSAAPLAEASVFGMPDWIITVFLQTGVAMILLTAQVGQLAAQCNASHMMLDYINNYFMAFTLAVSLAIEFSGVLHASYVIQMAVAKLAGKPLTSNEPPRSIGQNIFFVSRCLMSVAILVFSIVVTLTALFEGKTTMWKSIPESVAVILFVVLLSVVGLLEGMQIAFFAVSKMGKEERGNAKCAKMTCDLLFDEKGRNLPGFMIGRQICVVGCMFVAARVCTLNVEIGTGQNVLGVSDGFQSFLNTGLLAALITTIIGSIAWQLVASAFPLAFLSNPLVYVFLRWCLFLESTGICSGAWVLARVAELLTGWKTDTHYVGTPEDCRQREMDERALEEGKASKATEVAGQLQKGLTLLQSGNAPAKFASFCDKMAVKPQFGADAAAAVGPVEAFMAREGQCMSGVKTLADVIQDYEPTPKADRYPAPQLLAESYLKQQGEIPCFLLPPSHPLHVPPHIVAVWLISESESAKNTAQAEGPLVRM